MTGRESQLQYNHSSSPVNMSKIKKISSLLKALQYTKLYLKSIDILELKMIYLKGNILITIYQCRSKRISSRTLHLNGSPPTIAENFLDEPINCLFVMVADNLLLLLKENPVAKLVTIFFLNYSIQLKQRYYMLELYKRD